jgi:hypothetical protein
MDVGTWVSSSFRLLPPPVGGAPPSGTMNMTRAWSYEVRLVDPAQEPVIAASPPQTDASQNPQPESKPAEGEVNTNIK